MTINKTNFTKKRDEMFETLAYFIQAEMGSRCDDYYAPCKTCESWAAFDNLKNNLVDVYFGEDG